MRRARASLAPLGVRPEVLESQEQARLRPTSWWHAPKPEKRSQGHDIVPSPRGSPPPPFRKLSGSALQALRVVFLDKRPVIRPPTSVILVRRGFGHLAPRLRSKPTF